MKLVLLEPRVTSLVVSTIGFLEPRVAIVFMAGLSVRRFLERTAIVSVPIRPPQLQLESVVGYLLLRLKLLILLVLVVLDQDGSFTLWVPQGILKYLLMAVVLAVLGEGKLGDGLEVVTFTIFKLLFPHDSHVHLRVRIWWLLLTRKRQRYEVFLS